MDPVVAKYLTRYAAPEIAAGARLAGPYAHVCAIPALDESADLLDGLRDVDVDGRWLAIVVVNATDAAAPDVHGRNAALLEALRNAGLRGVAPAQRISDTPPMWLVPGARFDMDLLVVDRASPGWRLPADQGVGLARRVGCDIALALHASGALRTRWIHMTDADVTLPAEYFAAAARVSPDTVALAYRFWHEPARAAAPDTATNATIGATIGAATGLYELYLRYHRLGLAWAGSPYAWHTLGSSLAVDVHAYAAVRGVPRRQAAEDFYLVNKLVKLGPVREPDIAPIAIRARRSARVPFGTGAATRTIAGDLDAGRDYRVYHPRVYALLGAWLGAMAGFVASTAAAGADAVSMLEGALSAGAAAWQLSAEERRMLDVALARLDAPGALLDARTRARSPDALARRLRDWFDAFRTLKLIHAARDAGLPSLPWAEALARAPFLAGVATPATGGAPATLAAQLAPVRQALMERERGLDSPAACVDVDNAPPQPMLPDSGRLP